MRVSELMKENPVSIQPNSNLEQAAKEMNRIDCGILPVIDGNGCPVGVLTDRDIVVRCIADGRAPDVMLVSEACSSPAVCCDDDCTAENAFHTMREHSIGRLPVIDARGALIGIVSMADIIARVPKEIWSQLPGAKTAIPRKAA